MITWTTISTPTTRSFCKARGLCPVDVLSQVRWQTAPHSVALVMTEGDLAKPASRIPTLAPKWHWLAWVTRVGTRFVAGPEQPLPDTAALPLAWQTPADAYQGEQIVPLDPYTVS